MVYIPLDMEGKWVPVISGGIRHADPHERDQVMQIPIQMEGNWVSVISGGIRHADPHERGQVV